MSDTFSNVLGQPSPSVLEVALRQNKCGDASKPSGFDERQRIEAQFGLPMGTHSRRLLAKTIDRSLPYGWLAGLFRFRNVWQFSLDRWAFGAIIPPPWSWNLSESPLMRWSHGRTNRLDWS
jgi:hypothetical protein